MLFEAENSDLEELYITNKTFKNYKNIIFHYKGEEFLNFYALIAGILTNVITDFYEDIIVRKFLISNYTQLLYTS